MSHRGSLDIDGTKGCMGTAQKWEYHQKDVLLQASNRNLVRRCATDGDSFTSVFDLRGFVYRDAGCGTVNARRPLVPPCSVVHYTATKVTKATGVQCDRPPPCEELLARLRQRAEDARPPSESELARGRYYHGLRQARPLHETASPRPPPHR